MLTNTLQGFVWRGFLLRQSSWSISQQQLTSLDVSLPHEQPEKKRDGTNPNKPAKAPHQFYWFQQRLAFLDHVKDLVVYRLCIHCCTLLNIWWHLHGLDQRDLFRQNSDVLFSPFQHESPQAKLGNTVWGVSRAFPRWEWVDLFIDFTGCSERYGHVWPSIMKFIALINPDGLQRSWYIMILWTVFGAELDPKYELWIPTPRSY